MDYIAQFNKKIGTKLNNNNKYHSQIEDRKTNSDTHDTIYYLNM